MTNTFPASSALAGGSSPLADWVRMLGTLCLILGAVWVGLIWLRGRRWFQSAIDRRVRLRIDESRGLGNRSFLHLVSCGGQQFLVSSSPAGVSMIAEIAPDEPSAPPSPALASEFSQRLDEAVRAVPADRKAVP